MRAVTRWIEAAMVFSIGGCVVPVIRSPGTTPGRPVTPPIAVARNQSGSVRTVCRGVSVSGPWAVTDYVVSRQCETRGGLTYNAMTIEDLSYYPIGAEILICSDQRRPADWDYTGRDVGVTNQCPREPTNKVSSPTVVEIVRRRALN